MATAAAKAKPGVVTARHDHDHHGHAAPSVRADDAPPELEREPLVLNNRSIGWITNAIASICEKPMPKWWWPAFILSLGTMCMMFSLIAYLISTGVGVWGLNQP